MVYYKDNEWHISKLKVAYTEDKEECIKFVGAEGKVWWEELVENHTDIKITEFVDVNISDSQLERLEDVNKLGIKDGWSSVIGLYVISNNFPDEADHILKDLENKKTREANEDYLVDVDFRLSMQEIEI